MRRILITGGAGFVGSHLARDLKTSYPNWEIIAMDNLRRRGSELNLPHLKNKGIRFHHGDIREKEDFPKVPIDLFIDASAEPSVLAGYGGNTSYLLDTNLRGTLHSLEVCKENKCPLIFLSTNRVYSIPQLEKIPLTEGKTRFELGKETLPQGLSRKGINEAFPTSGPRSIYGTTKLASELFIEEYADAFKIKTVINRFSVITGPGQLARPDQGIFAFWLWQTLQGAPLKYIGFGGTGKQVRDFIDIRDVSNLILTQLDSWKNVVTKTLNIGGGVERSLSLLETTKLAKEILPTSKTKATAQVTQRKSDIPWFITDSTKIQNLLEWTPQYSKEKTFEDMLNWMIQNEDQLKGAL